MQNAASLVLMLAGIAGLVTAGVAVWQRRKTGALRDGLPPLRWIALAALLLLIAGVALSPSDSPDPAGRAAKSSSEVTPASAEPKAKTASSSSLVAEAHDAVRSDDYAEAMSLVAGLERAKRSRVRRMISRRIASRARAAVRRGNRSLARELLAEARRYPTLPEVISARAALTTATNNARAAREKAAAEREASRAAEEAANAQPAPLADAPTDSGGCEPGYDPCVPTYPPDLDCGELGGPYQVTGGDPHGLDRDGDGIGCE